MSNRNIDCGICVWFFGGQQNRGRWDGRKLIGSVGCRSQLSERVGVRSGGWRVKCLEMILRKGHLLLKPVTVEVGECRRQEDGIIREEVLSSTEWSVLILSV